MACFVFGSLNLAIANVIAISIDFIILELVQCFIYLDFIQIIFFRFAFSHKHTDSIIAICREFALLCFFIIS